MWLRDCLQHGKVLSLVFKMSLPIRNEELQQDMLHAMLIEIHLLNEFWCASVFITFEVKSKLCATCSSGTAMAVPVF